MYCLHQAAPACRVAREHLITAAAYGLYQGIPTTAHPTSAAHWQAASSQFVWRGGFRFDRAAASMFPCVRPASRLPWQHHQVRRACQEERPGRPFVHAFLDGQKKLRGTLELIDDGHQAAIIPAGSSLAASSVTSSSDSGSANP